SVGFGYVPARPPPAGPVGGSPAGKGCQFAFPAPSADRTKLFDAAPLVTLSLDTANGASLGLVTLPSASAAVTIAPGAIDAVVTLAGAGVAVDELAAKMAKGAEVTVKGWPFREPLTRMTQFPDGEFGTGNEKLEAPPLDTVRLPRLVNVTPPSVLRS